MLWAGGNLSGDLDQISSALRASGSKVSMNGQELEEAVKEIQTVMSSA